MNELTITEEIKRYEAMAKNDRQAEEAYARLGQLYKEIRDYKRSVVSYRQALIANSKHENHAKTKAIYALEAGICCALIQEYPAALAWWQTAIDLYPEEINPYLNIAYYHEEQNQLNQAEAFLIQALNVAKNDSRPDYSLARIYSKQEQWEKALSHYQNQVKTDSQHGQAEDPWIHCNLATCHLQMGQSAKALQHFEKAMALAPESEAGRYAKSILAELASF